MNYFLNSFCCGCHHHSNDFVIRIWELPILSKSIVGFPQRTLSTFELSRETQMTANKKAARGGDQMINFHRWVVLFFHVLSEFWFQVP
jgi:hypothetical protein